MKIVRCLGPAFAVLTLISLAFTQDVHTDYDHHVNFGQYKTYSWAKVHTEDPLWQPRITDAIDKALQAKG